ncbi:Piso0_002014 [Millerozyma farinosa CBS 7064]|uniref:Piso0_002014 protein n=1 Tax=Pichia sorbitophila (strain ATCC MYA-4447 / BCRC 22081 / CBS 7064 / NBRC 10061 / NRRL Y-12695) TaxID=559304 RepID=G8YBG3_PICSO|nr:Piso0_002014 [Millerozyma farinosa CBS 7064]
MTISSRNSEEDSESSSIFSSSTIMVEDNYDPQVFEKFCNERRSYTEDGGISPDTQAHIHLIHREQSYTIALVEVWRFIQGCLFERPHYIPLNKVNMTHLLLYLFFNIYTYSDMEVRYINQIKVIHRGQAGMVDLSSGLDKDSLLCDLRIVECPSMHLVIGSIPSHPIPVICPAVFILSSLNNDSKSGSTTYAEALLNRIRSRKERKLCNARSNLYFEKQSSQRVMFKSKCMGAMKKIMKT